jgi:ABC-2 type transport system ATP-binding protein
MALIEARSLGKSFGTHRAVDDLSFTVRPGSVTGFLGPNGSGKSTTMRLMLGLDSGDGSTTFDGVPFARLDHPMRHVGALLEAKPFHPTRKARNHLRMLAAPNGIADRRVDEVIDMVGLTGVARGRPGRFSLGMGQRLGLAAALLGDPQTLILDEPSNGLDPQGITWLRTLLQHLASQGRSVFVSSHLLQEMALLADELVVIGRGRMLANGPVSDFISHSSLGSVTVRTPDLAALGPALEALGATVSRAPDGDGDAVVVRGATAEQVGDAAHAAGARLHQLATREATLEEAFLEATGLSEEFRGSSGGPDADAPDGPSGAGRGPGVPA